MNKNYKSSLIVGFILFLGFCFLHSEPVVRYSQVEFDLSKVTMQELGGLGLPIDHHDVQGETVLEMPVSQYDIQILNENKIPYKLLVSDYAKFIEDRILNYDLKVPDGESSPRPSVQPPVNFTHGSMGGMLTYSEIQRELDKMRSLFPNLASAKFSIGETGENRSLWGIRISNNPDVDQDKPRVLYEAMIHAREPMGMMNLFYFGWYLLEEYDKNPNVKRLVDNLEIYIVPLLNPDGYEYNRSTNPNGGGMWRKNRVQNSNGTRGVDVNRNFSVFWGNNVGSSNNPQSDAYRGTSAFSEKESQALRDFHLEKKFYISQSYHTYANVLIHPYGEGSNPSNLTEYQEIARDMVRSNGWRFGNVPFAVGYSATGVTIDWIHDIAGAYAFGGELGSRSDGFWPSPNRIDPLSDMVLNMNLEMAVASLPAVLRVEKPYQKIKTDFFGNVDVQNGHLKFNYQLMDAEKSWFLTLHNLQGKKIKQINLTPSLSSIELSGDEIPGSMFMLKVKSCDKTGCNSVYSKKIVTKVF